MTDYYLAYGSNLHPFRIKQRLPGAELIGNTKIDGFSLTFHKRGQDASGKGHIHADNTQNSHIYGAVYRLGKAQKGILDEIEGPGYGTSNIDVRIGQDRYSCFAYIGMASHLDKNLTPFHWYKSLILLGAQFHQFPDYYIRAIEQVPSTEDPDPIRRQQQERLIAAIIDTDRQHLNSRRD